MMDNVIELRHVHKSFDGFQLKDFSMNVKKVLSPDLSAEMAWENRQRLN